MARSLMIN